MDKQTIGYIVVEYNQASHQPGLLSHGDIHPTYEEAQEAADLIAAIAKANGRRERYAVGTVTVEDDGN